MASSSMLAIINDGPVCDAYKFTKECRSDYAGLENARSLCIGDDHWLVIQSVQEIVNAIFDVLVVVIAFFVIAQCWNVATVTVVEEPVVRILDDKTLSSLRGSIFTSYAATTVP